MNRLRNKSLKFIHYASRRPKLFAGFGILIFLAFGLALAFNNLFLHPPVHAASSANTVLLNYNHTEHTVPTQAKTVGELLNELKIKINKGDVVEPALKAKINQDKFRINIYRARPVVIVDGKHKTYSFSAAASPRAVAEQAGVKVYAEDNFSVGPVTDFAQDNAIGEKIVIDRATPVNLMLYGHVSTVRTHAKTVAELLSEKGIELKKGDTLTPAPETALTSGMEIVVAHRGVKFATVIEKIPAPVSYINDADLTLSTEAIRQEGSDGERSVTYKIATKNGKEVGRTIIQEVTTKKPVARIIAIGVAQGSDSREAWLKQLRDCESGGNYQANTGNNFYGAYQFLDSTWDSLNTGYARADLAPPAVQDRAIIINTNRTAGLVTQNPGCFYKTGISNKPPQ